MSTAPVVPPRPSRADKEMPKIPPRPINKRLDRSMSPNRDRFAPSPINGGILPKDTKPASRLGQQYGQESPIDPLDRSNSVSMPSVGEEGAEYSAVAEELNKEAEHHATSPKQMRTVSDDLKLHAPKPSLPASSAKKQVMTVTRTDSERAASFGIGRATSHHADERAVSRNSVKKRPSSSFSAHSDHQTDDEHGIPEIGQRVPMNPHLGDVQAPSPSPGPGCHGDGTKKNHNRKLSARGLPPGSYGLHGHGVSSQDKLDKAYYNKHPEALEREQHTPMLDRNNDFAMSSSDLNRLVRDTASRQAGLGTREFVATPTEEVAFHASEEYTSRITCAASPRKDAPQPKAHGDVEEPIHVEDKHPEYYHYGAEDDESVETEEEYHAPILAADEVDAGSHVKHPAVRPHPERHSSHDGEESPVRSTSRPSMARASHSQADFGSTPLEDVEEYEPLFSEETKEEVPKHEAADENEGRHHFPSKDVWEDAPSSVHYTATVSTPDVSDQIRRRSSAYSEDRPITPAQAFAQYQEQLAEKETTGRNNVFLPLSEEKPTWINHQHHLKTQRPSAAKRFPSRDVWEDVPESQLHETTVSASPTEEKKPEMPSRPEKKASLTEHLPSIPDRPRPRQSSGDDKQKPPVSEKPKPQVPARPSKSLSGDSKTKPPVPSRLMGNKIASLQAGFMSDLNKRLQIGPQAPKKEPLVEEEAEAEEKAPLSDARKGRARGPQRRAPARTAATAAVSASMGAPALKMSAPLTLWTIDPDDGDVSVGSATESETETLGKSTPPEEALSLEKAGQTDALVQEPQEMEKAEDEAEEKVLKESSESQGSGDGPTKVEKSLVSNMAGESILEATVEEGAEGVEPVEVRDDVK
ncbi:hypothetical protein CDD81_1638 [Ophiocordyceps australis]|uniref:Altered inheritance of mitochondria protein 21 n=1 Tax=Ophiocordyceps australis TaxID=1399860 RepID=A0A2C5XYJ3_9HYPO|nr:hypothetical protein CDD81_1638 [Ophiocordyceps australis]